jgi:hypothetical protein
MGKTEDEDKGAIRQKQRVGKKRNLFETEYVLKKNGIECADWLNISISLKDRPDCTKRTKRISRNLH